MNRNNYYYHGTGGYKGTYTALDRLSSIFNDGKIKVSKNVECVDHSIHNGNKRNYLCDTRKPYIEGLSSSYELYIETSPSLALSRELEVITPKYTRARDSYEIERTNLYDEVRTDYDISLDHLCFILLPVKRIEQVYQDKIYDGKIERETKQALLARLRFMRNSLLSAKKFDKTLPVIDTITQKTITEESLYDIEEIISKEQMTLKKAL